MASMETKLKMFSRPYFYSACMICMETKNIKYCARCEVAPYCGKEHQKIDWPYHKDFCKSFSCVNISIWEQPSPEIFFTARYGLVKLIEISVGRKLKSHEHLMCCYPKVCITCFTHDDLITCSLCNCASFCTKHYKLDYNKHTKYCSELKLCFDLNKYFWTNGIYGSDIKVKPIMPKKHLLEEAAKFIEFTDKVPCDIEQILKEFILSGTLNIIDVFYKLGLIKNQQFIKKEMVLHLIISHSDFLFYLNLNKCREFVFHWLNNLEYLKLVYFDCSTVGDGIILSNELSGLCENCVKNKQVEIELHDKDYYLKDGLVSPDLIFFFEVDFSENDWKEAIPIMLEFRKPICFTASNSVMVNNIKYLESCGIKSQDYILQNELNHFCNKLPVRNPLLDSEISPVIYNDTQISIIFKN